MDLDDLFTKAHRLQSNSQLPQAIELYENILSQDPAHQESLHFLGLAYAQLGDMDSAITYLLQALHIQSNNRPLLNNLANAYKKNHQYEEAIHYYLQAIELQPDYAQAHNNLATVYALQNQYQQALKHYIKAVHSEPDFSSAHFNLGLLLLQNKQLAAAKTQFCNVLSLNPDHSEAEFYLGVLFLEENLLAEAEQRFQRLLEEESHKGAALVNLGVIALKREQNQVAVDYFSKALALNNENVDARNNLASTFMHHDRFENALMHYDVLLQHDPNNIEYLYNSGVAQMALGHLNEAMVHFEQVLHLQKDHTASLNNMAAIHLKMDQRETARNYLQQALAINPQDRISSHMLQAITGSKTTDSFPANTSSEYAQNLFNNYALYYDQHMQGPLKYSIPQHIGQMLHELQLIQVNTSLDLGCGTGLTGIVLREISNTLIGVDISNKMLTHAKEKGIYDQLIACEIIDFFRDSRYSQQLDDFELIVAADVLPYFGDLQPVFQAVHQHLSCNGYFLFTIEISSHGPWFLETSARFSHHPDYIKDLSSQYTFEIIKQKKVPARLQNQQPLEVMLYAVRKVS